MLQEVDRHVNMPYQFPNQFPDISTNFTPSPSAHNVTHIATNLIANSPAHKVTNISANLTPKLSANICSIFATHSPANFGTYFGAKFNA